MTPFNWDRHVDSAAGECWVRFSSDIVGHFRAEVYFSRRDETTRGSFEMSGWNANRIVCATTEIVAQVTGERMVRLGEILRDDMMVKYDAWLEKYENNDD